MGVARPAAVLVAFLALLLARCTAGGVEFFEPEGGLARGLTVKVELEAAAAEIGEALGWGEGVPEAEVRVHRMGTDFSWQTARTDAGGVARLPDLIPGRYRVAAYRALSDEEVEQLGGRRRAFGDGRIIALSGPRALTLTLAPDQRGSLLISEVYRGEPPPVEANYDYACYLEVYNNSDTTIYLDRKILGWAYHMDSDCGPWHCDQTAVFRNVPHGVWARIHFQRFPGSGTEYPLAAGASAVLAMDAVDHSRFYPGLPNLAHADFEFLGPADVDNPEVPNMPEGLESWWGGHGLRLSTDFTYFLSEPVDVETLPQAWDDWGQSAFEIRFFPRDLLLDVVATQKNSARWDRECPPCAEKVHRNFDRLAGGFLAGSADFEYSAQRVVLDTTPDGRAILQDTNTSAVDLIRAPYTVGTLPEEIN